MAGKGSREEAGQCSRHGRGVRARGRVQAAGRARWRLDASRMMSRGPACQPPLAFGVQEVEDDALLIAQLVYLLKSPDADEQHRILETVLAQLLKCAHTRVFF